jgi:hypothetical protein
MAQSVQSTAEEPKEEKAMQTIDLEFLSLSSYARLCTLISICLGFATGILLFIADILGVDTSVRIGIVHFDNIESGVIALFTGPFIFAVVGFVGSLFSYRLFLWALRKYWGLALTGRWKEVSSPAIHETHGNHLHVS